MEAERGVGRAVADEKQRWRPPGATGLKALQGGSGLGASPNDGSTESHTGHRGKTDVSPAVAGAA